MINIKYNLQELLDYIVVPWLVLKDNVRKVAKVKESNLKHENMTKQTLGDAEEASANKKNSNKSDQSSRKFQSRIYINNDDGFKVPRNTYNR